MLECLSDTSTTSSFTPKGNKVGIKKCALVRRWFLGKRKKVFSVHGQEDRAKIAPDMGRLWIELKSAHVETTGVLKLALTEFAERKKTKREKKIPPAKRICFFGHTNTRRKQSRSEQRKLPNTRDQQKSSWRGRDVPGSHTQCLRSPKHGRNQV